MNTNTQPTACVIASALSLADTDERAEMVAALKSRKSAAKVVDVIAGFPVTDALPISAKAVLQHRRGECVCANPHQKVETPEGVSNRAVLDMSATEGTFTTGVLDAPVEGNKFDFVFEQFGLDPALYEIVGETVRMSTWQQGSRDPDTGEWEAKNLYAYRATFKPRVTASNGLPPVDLTGWSKNLIQTRVRPSKPAETNAHGTYTFMVADPQLGKKGTDQAVENWQRGVKGHLQEAANLIKLGQSPEAIHIAFMGDEVEGVMTSYKNQPHTVEYNLSEQVQMDTELRTWTIREALNLGLPVSVSSVISNHGETWVRDGKDPITTKSDNLSTSVARQVKFFFDSFAPEAPLTWHIANADPSVIVNLSGINTLFTHGHIQKGRGASTELRTKVAMERQIVANPGYYATIPLYVTAHYHHEGLLTGEGRYYASCPALEAEKSSEYMLDQYGVWSRPGMLGMLIGENVAETRPFTRWNVF